MDDKDITDDIMEEEIFVDEEPELEDLEFEVALKKVVDEVRDPVQNQKMRVLDHLRLHFANIEKDYKIRHISKLSKKQLFEYITDFCDPVLKLVIDFPDTFWHNNDRNIEPLKYHKLQEKGWKVLIVNGKAPGPKDIDKVIDAM